MQQLRLNDPTIYVSSFNRQNLYYEVVQKFKKAYPQLLKKIKQYQGKDGGAGIIYCLSRKHVDEVSAKLRQDGIAALPYHAGLKAEERENNQNKFIRDDVQIIVATIAFGMGINKPDVRFVIHYDLPRNLESYYQEAGRAGRDGEAASCTILFGWGDVHTVKYLIGRKVDADEQRIAQQQLNQIISYAESSVCRRKIQLSYFGEEFVPPCDNCDNCLNPSPIEDWTVEAQKFLSCVYRCDQRFGMNHVIDVLRGSKKKRIVELNHNQLSTHGIGKGRTSDEWKMLCRALIHQGYLEETTDGYSVLQLNKESNKVLKKLVSVEIPVVQKIAKPVDVKPASSELNDKGGLLMSRLKRLRKELADRQNVPPYVVFSDASLRQMAQTHPQTPEAFLNISGVGNRKLIQYGEVFTKVIRNFCAENNLEIIPEQLFPDEDEASDKAKAQSDIASTHLKTLDLFKQGLSPSDISLKRNIRLNTVNEHLAKLIEAGYPIDIDKLIDKKRRTAIEEAIAKVSPHSLRNIREEAGETYDYQEIKLVRAKWGFDNADQ